MYNVALAGEGLVDAAGNELPCVADPQYSADMCGFNDKLECVQLNGCGDSTIFPYLTSFTLAVTFVALNLFVGIILDGFQSANESDRTIKPVSPERKRERERDTGRGRQGGKGEMLPPANSQPPAPHDSGRLREVPADLDALRQRRDHVHQLDAAYKARSVHRGAVGLW